MTERRTSGLWAGLASLLLVGACAGDEGRGDDKEARATAHVLPLQAVSLQGFMPEGAGEGLIRFEAEHFAYELPLTTSTPATVLAPIYVAEDGSLGGGKVALFWVPADGEEPAQDAGDGGTSATEASSVRPENAVDLGLELTVEALPRFAYNDQPGVLVHTFLSGARAFLEVAYRDAIASAATTQAVELTKTRDDSIASLSAALELIEAVRGNGADQAMGEISFGSNDVALDLSPASLTISDQLVAAFLIASRAGTWQPHGAQVATGKVSGLRQALLGDLVSEAREWFPRMTDRLASDALERASQLSSAVGHATMAVGILGTLGLVAAPTALAATAVGAFSFFALTYAPAATAAVIRAAGNLVRGGGSLNGYGYDSVAPSLKHVLSQNLSYCLGKLQDKITNKIAGVSKGAAILTQLGSAVSGFIDAKSSKIANWFVDCAGDRSKCTSQDDSDGGAGGGGGTGGTGGDGGPTVGTCNEAQTAGGDEPESRTFDVGTACADLTLSFDTLSVQDSITVSYEGQVVADTGCVGQSGNLPFSICGSSTEILVSVTPNCAGGSGTAWSFTLMCPE